MFMSPSEMLAVWSDRRPSELSGEVETSPVKALHNELKLDLKLAEIS